MSRIDSNNILSYDYRPWSKILIRRNWSDLRALGSSRLLKTSWIWLAIVPMTAKIFENIETIKLPALGENFILEIDLPFSWHVLFYSSFFFAAASALYAICCPKIVKSYANLAELKIEHESHSLVSTVIVGSLFDAIATNYKGNLLVVNDLLQTFFSRYRDTNNFSGKTMLAIESDKKLAISLDDTQIAEQKIEEAFRFARFQADISKPWSILVCWYFYILGFSLLLLLTLQSFAFVTKSFYLSYLHEGTWIALMIFGIPIVLLVYVILSRFNLRN